MSKFNDNEVYYKIYDDWKHFADKLNATKMVIGISGGIDSAICAALAKRIFGEKNVYGMSMACDDQKDSEDVNKVFDLLKIERLNFNIGDTFYTMLGGLENNAIDVSEQTKTNLPARIRMTALYAFSQSIPNSIVINTSNLSERISAYCTLFGDTCGSYAPIQDLTKTEVKKLATYIGLPEWLVEKTPTDGLQDKSDEENLGYTYANLDNYIRNGIGTKALISEVLYRYENNGKVKMNMIHIEGPKFDFKDYVQKKNI